jgi:hypothetical protein
VNTVEDVVLFVKRSLADAEDVPEWGRLMFLGARMEVMEVLLERGVDLAGYRGGVRG